MVSFGISITPNKPIDEWVRLSKIVEDLGIENIWVADESPSPSFRDIFVTLTAIAMHTQKVRLGTSICNPYSRHPTLIAVAILTLDDISNGRTIVGLGPGGSLPLNPLGIPKWRKSVKTVRTTVKLLRKLFAGEKVDYQDDVLKFDGVKLFSKPKEKIPIYLAARGPKMLELVGELADGALLTALPLEVVDQAIERIRAGARKIGRSFDEVDIAYLLRFSISQDDEEAKELVKPNVAYGVADSPPYVIERAGIKEG